MQILTTQGYSCQHLRIPWTLPSLTDTTLPASSILCGWDVAAGLALHASRLFYTTLKGLICINGFYSVPRLQAHYPLGWQWAQAQFPSLPHDFVPDTHLQNLNQIPLLIIHSQNNTLYPTDEAKLLYRKYPGPKTLSVLPNVDHREWLTPTHPMFKHAFQVIHSWIQGLNGF